MKMSMPLGGRTITTTVTGGGDNVVKLLVLAAAIALPLTIIVAWATQIEIALTIITAMAVIAGAACLVWQVLPDVYWPGQRSRVRAFSAQVDATFAAQTAGPAAPLRVTAERVRELDAPGLVAAEAYVVDPDREREPVNLDELGR